MHVGERILKYFVIPIRRPGKFGMYHQIMISLSKPTAVTFADAPVVEMTIDSDPYRNPRMQAWFVNNHEAKLPPSPLQGRLDEWIASNEIKME